MRSRKNYTSFSIPVLTIAAVALTGCQGHQSTSETAGSEPTAPAAEKGAVVKTVQRWLAPKPVVKSVPAGTTMQVELLETLSSKGSHTGDSFTARVADDVVVGGTVVIPAGSSVRGTVTEATPLKKIGGRARLGLSFTSVEPPAGAMSPIDADFSVLGKSETKKDTATIAGSTVGGAILGRVLGHKKGEEAKGTAVGAAVGAAAGTAAAAITKGHEVVLPAGKVIAVELDTNAQVTVKS